jgi:hypothetical protein
MMQISRKVHCALAGMDIEAFKTLQRYGRLPVLPAEFRPEKGFGPLETLVLATYNAMVEQFQEQHNRMFRAYAADICSAAAILSTRWNELRETLMQRRLAEKNELLFGRVTLPGTLRDGGGPRPVLGTFEEIAAEHPAAITIIAISVSRVADLLRNRAAKHGIDIEQFWAEPFLPPASKTRPRKRGPRR